MELNISIELGGAEYPVGVISGEGVADARFTYDKDYISQPDSIPVSASLPFQDAPFTPEQTRCYFEGLLPEGFTRKTVASWIHADDRDYLQILSALGKEFLGALKVTDAAQQEEIPFDYEKLTLDQVRALAQEGATKSAELVTRAHLSLTGASGKVGLYYDQQERQWYLPIGSAPSTHIIKQSHIRLNAIVTNEQLSILTAKKLGIEVPDTFIINTGNFHDADVLFATARYDRMLGSQPATEGGHPVPLRLHQEDFGQALGIPAADKYEPAGLHYMRDSFALLRRNSSNPIQDQLKLWDLIVFNFLLGNTDAHLKNYSLLHGQNPKSVRLAPAYDLISTTAYKSSTRDMSFRIGGRLSVDEIGRSAFQDAAREVGLGQRIAMQHFDALADRFEAALQQTAAELTEQGYHQAAAIAQEIMSTGGIHHL